MVTFSSDFFVKLYYKKMEFKTTNNMPNLCFFCYKSIPLEYNHHQNTAKVIKFCEILTRLLDCQNTKIKQTLSILSLSSLGSCKDCEIISSQVLDIYHELKCLELRLFWKLETLGKKMNLADIVPSRNVFEKEYLENHDNKTNSKNGTFSTQVKAFKSFRTTIMDKFNNGKMTRHQPRVLLTRLDHTTEIPDRHIQDHSHPKTLVNLHVFGTDDGPDKRAFDTDIGTLSSSIAAAPTDSYLLSERLLLKDTTQEFAVDSAAEQCSSDRNQQIISSHLLDSKIKTEQCNEENSSDNGDDIRDTFSNSSESLIVPDFMTKIEVRSTQDRLQKVDKIPNTSITASGDTWDNDSNKIYNFRKGNKKANPSTEKAQLSLDLPSESSDSDGDYKPVKLKSKLNAKYFKSKQLKSTKALMKQKSSKSHQQATTKKNGKSFICEVCGYSFKESTPWKRHMEYHKKPEDWQFECSICKKKCANKQQLRRHTHTHTANKPWECDQCGKKFPIQEYLNKHLKSHFVLKSSEGWKYQCSSCGKKCASKQALEDHQQVHTNEKPMICEQCGRGFKRERNLKRHLKCHLSLTQHLNLKIPQV